LIVMCFEIGN